jgi:RND family efflux transporter MFP subunit
VTDRKVPRLLGRLRGAAARADGGPSDAQLLDRFASTGDEAAFELLVWRHQGLVFGVCRRVLQDDHEAEDAFQAAFLTLARKAAAVVRREAVAGWLYRVAYRVALTARTARLRRAGREKSLDAAATVAAPADPALLPEQRELRAVVDEEVNRLPEKFRAAVALCYLEGKSVEEAAVQLGCPRGTVASRLARARKQLHGRLSRRGLTLATAAGLTLAAPDRLIHATARAAGSYVAAVTAGATAAPVVPVKVVAMTEGVLKTMFYRKLVTGVVVLLTLAGALLVGGGLAARFGLAALAGEKEPPEKEQLPGKDQVPPPRTVAVTRPVQGEAVPFEEFVGRLEARQTVEVRPQVSGILEKVSFKAGAEVKKGDVLFEIDPRPYQAEVDQAEAKLAVAAARRKQADADLARAKALAGKGGVSREELDQITLAATVAAAEEKRAQADRERARLLLDYTKVAAPISGRVGHPLVDPGNVVSAAGQGGGTVLVRLTSLDPIGLAFEMDERSFLEYQKLLRAGQVKGEGSPLQVQLANEQGFPHTGTLDSFDTGVNPVTGTIRVRGGMPNPERRLLPGMFVRVRVPFGKPRRVLQVPDTAVGAEKDGRFVLVVNKEGVVERRAVRQGRLEDGLRIIEKGLDPDDWVVVDRGPQPGDKVEPRPTPPAEKPAPKD